MLSVTLVNLSARLELDVLARLGLRGIKTSFTDEHFGVRGLSLTAVCVTEIMAHPLFYDETRTSARQLAEAAEPEGVAPRSLCYTSTQPITWFSVPMIKQQGFSLEGITIPVCYWHTNQQ